MKDKELTSLLQQVQSELEDAEEVSDDQRELMRELMDDLRHTLGEEGEEPHGVGERLGDAVDQFEQSHPTLAFTLRRIIDALARMGI